MLWMRAKNKNKKQRSTAFWMENVLQLQQFYLIRIQYRLGLNKIKLCFE